MIIISAPSQLGLSYDASMVVTYYDERYALASDLVQNNFQPGKTDPFLSQHRTVRLYGCPFLVLVLMFFFIFETEHFRKVGRDNLGYYTCYLILDVNKCLEISRRVHETMVRFGNIMTRILGVLRTI